MLDTLRVKMELPLQRLTARFLPNDQVFVSRTISLTVRVFLITLLPAALMLLSAGSYSNARAIELTKARITVISVAPPRIRVEGERAEGAKAWSLRNTYAGVMGLGERIEKFQLADANGHTVATRKLAPSEFEAAKTATHFTYEVKLDPPAAADAAHVSWLTSERGVLFLGDLLPLPLEQAQVSLTLPEGWKVAASEITNAQGGYDLTAAENSVFFLGTDIREKLGHASALDFTLAMGGDWPFTESNISEMVTGILKEHIRTTGYVPRGRVVVIVAPFPVGATSQRWSAETRGATVCLLSGRAPSKASGLAQISVPLVHELFHLWVPNSLPLDGDYSWFYEGFTLYQSLLSGLTLEHLNFQDYLNAIARAFTDYTSTRMRDQYSLLDATQRRWSGSSQLVYGKGLLVACLYDLALRQKSNGKASLAEVYRDLFRHRYSDTEKPKSDVVVLEILDHWLGSREFTKTYVRGNKPIELSSLLLPFGLQVQGFGARTVISVMPVLTSSQRELLRRIGYNGPPRPKGRG